jgi:hypothetical protein
MNVKGQKTNNKFLFLFTPAHNAKSKGSFGLIWTPHNIRKWQKHVLYITDSFSKCVELVAIPDKEGPTVTSALFSRWLCRIGSLA